MRHARCTWARAVSARTRARTIRTHSRAVQLVVHMSWKKTAQQGSVSIVLTKFDVEEKVFPWMVLFSAQADHNGSREGK